MMAQDAPQAAVQGAIPNTTDEARLLGLDPSEVANVRELLTVRTEEIAQDDRASFRPTCHQAHGEAMRHRHREPIAFLVRLASRFHAANPPPAPAG